MHLIDREETRSRLVELDAGGAFNILELMLTLDILTIGMAGRYEEIARVGSTCR